MNFPDLRRKMIALRTNAGLTQRDVARISGMDDSTVSSFENTGERLRAIKLWQLEQFVLACGMGLVEFLATDADTLEGLSEDERIDRGIACAEFISSQATHEVYDRVCGAQSSLAVEHRLRLP